MDRRQILRWLTAGAFVGQAPVVLAARPATCVLVQESPLAGFQYHAGEQLWPRLWVGAPLTLAREADNRYDQRAVALLFDGERIGYLPKIDNAAASQLLDRGQPLRAHIASLAVDPNPWKRVRVALELEV